MKKHSKDWIITNGLKRILQVSWHKKKDKNFVKNEANKRF